MTRFTPLALSIAVTLTPSIPSGGQTPRTGQAAAPPATIAGNVTNGQRLFVKDTCYFCHGYAGQGGRDGARIAVTSMSPQALIRYVRRPFGAMPAFTEKVISDQELLDIHAYLKSMPLAKPAGDIPLLNQLRD